MRRSHGKRRELHSSRPAVGLRGCLVQFGVREIRRQSCEHQARLGRRELELCESEFRDLTPDAHAIKRESRIHAADEYHVQPRRQMLHEHRQRLGRGLVLEDVNIVDDEHAWLHRMCFETIQQHMHDVGNRRCAHQQLVGIESACRSQLFERGDHP